MKGKYDEDQIHSDAIPCRRFCASNSLPGSKVDGDPQRPGSYVAHRGEGDTTFPQLSVLDGSFCIPDF